MSGNEIWTELKTGLWVFIIVGEVNFRWAFPVVKDKVNYSLRQQLIECGFVILPIELVYSDLAEAL